MNRFPRLRGEANNKIMYTIWLMPSLEDATQLSPYIEAIAKPLNAPFFVPHITLLSRIEGDEKAVKNLCQQLAFRNQFKVSIQQLSGHDAYFRCLFLELKKEHDILDIRQLAEQLFTHSSYPDFMPHLSLLYADISEEKRYQLIQNWTKKIDMLSISISKICLMKTLGEVQDWNILGEWKLA